MHAVYVSTECLYTYYKSRICQIDVKCMRKTKCTDQCDSCFERQRKQTELKFPDKQRSKLQQRRETDQEQGSQQQERGKKPTPIEGESSGLSKVMNSRGVFKTAEVAAKQFKKDLKQRRE